jgi:hypothetical protein
MRKRVVVAAITAVVAAGLAVFPGPRNATPAAHAAVSPNIVLFYKFDAHRGASVIDSSNSHLDGTLINAAPSTSYVPSRTGYRTALSLAAAQHQYVDVPQGPTLDVNRFTLAALVRYTGVQTPETLDRWEVLEKAGAYWINIRTDGHVRAGGFFGGCANNRYWKYFDSTRTVPTNTWTHVASTYNGSKLTIYIDGVAAGSMNVSGTTCANDEPLAVGAKNAPAKGLLEAFWDGQLDDVRVYNKALTANQIANLAP